MNGVRHWWLVIWLLTTSGCFFLPKIVKEETSIFVSLFQNDTKEYSLSEELNLAIIEEMMKDGIRLEERESADLILSGRILEYKKIPLGWTLSKKITEYRLSARVFFELKKDDKVMLKDMAISSITYSANEEYYKKRLLRSLARIIVNKIR